MRRADKHTHIHVPLKRAVVTPCIYQPFLGAHVGGNTEQEINMLKKKRDVPEVLSIFSAFY